jgi:hypothetical protein
MTMINACSRATPAKGLSASGASEGSALVMLGDRLLLVFDVHDLLEQQLVDAAVVHVDDLDLESAQLQDLALVGHARQLVQHQACDGVEAVASPKSSPSRSAQLVQVGLAVDQPAAVLALASQTTSASSWPSSKSPAIISSRSVAVTTPSKAPNSSTRKAMWTLEAFRISSAFSTEVDCGMKAGVCT